MSLKEAETGMERAAAVQAERSSAPALQPTGFERLHTLVRAGYVAEAATSGPAKGVMLRKPNGPALLLYADGTLETLDKGKPLHAGLADEPDRISARNADDRRNFERFVAGLAPAAPAANSRPVRLWRRRIAVPVLFVALWIMSILLTAWIGNGM